ncbi:hypothetical protein QMG61_06380 [Cryobacterium sp. PH31-AA6]|uniref:hypothetical protein n=1 Tax=Cryobacterium sp. PH31-AA6 TaxID=3046205 RepID=UPI0024B881ED|nr:hypothetical protein [Cryobacterium sp. PH31-AA6]MDJ0323388.1 hypothetical protein [Cryobacterium sp. PH31-AA6]
MAIHHVAVIGGRGVVYIDAREEHLTPDEARRLATRLIELAHQAERPADPDWP